MDKPSRLAFSDYATFRLLRAEIIYYFGFMISVFTLVLIGTDGPVKDLALPAAVFGGIGLVLIGIFFVAAWIYRMGEQYQVKRMFAGEIWECWQFSAQEWEAEVESVCSLINPKDDGIPDYMGVVNSSIFGAVIAIIMAAIGFFVVKDPLIKKALWIAAGAVFLLSAGAGAVEPLVLKNKADRYRRKALQFREPRVWFSADGIYHEALGHASLKGLFKVTDQTKSRKAIQFKRRIKTDESDDVDVITSPVPAGCEERAGRLVLRYRRERLQS